MGDTESQAYYATGPADLGRVVLDALRRAGGPTEPIDPDDLAGLDEFHGLGRAATLALIDLAAIPSGARVLDIGAGIGGPARTIARHCEAQLTALDPTTRFCDLARELNRRSGLDRQVEVICADARAMPLEDGVFDFAITQAVWPSIEEKPAMLAEAHRVIRSGGRLAIYEAVEGRESGPLEFPLPWADGTAESFLVSADQAQELAADAGFELLEWLQGADALGPIGARAEDVPEGAQGVDLSLLMPDFEARMGSVGANIVAGRIELAMAVFSRP